MVKTWCYEQHYVQNHIFGLTEKECAIRILMAMALLGPCE